MVSPQTLDLHHLSCHSSRLPCIDTGYPCRFPTTWVQVGLVSFDSSLCRFATSFMDMIRWLLPDRRTTSTYLETMINKFDELPFRGSKPIVSPFLIFERWQIFISISSKTKVIKSLHTKSEVRMEILWDRLTFWIAKVDSRQLLMLPHRVWTHRSNWSGLIRWTTHTC